MNEQEIAEQAYKNGYEKGKSEAKAEIERLKQSNKNILFVNEYTMKKNEELEKQVDELTDHLSEKQNALWDLQDDFDNLLVDGKHQAVKDTAKEILAMFNDRNYITENDLKKAIAERYGVEVQNG